jgi:hypothetical protein
VRSSQAKPSQKLDEERRNRNQFGRTEHVYHAIILEITLVPDEHDGNRLSVFDAQDLFVVCANQVERIPFGDRVHEEEALAVEHVVLPHRAISYNPPKRKHPRSKRQNREKRRRRANEKKKKEEN